jgi:hypothetical protein
MRYIIENLTACDEDMQYVKQNSPSMADGIFCSVGGIDVCTNEAESAMTGLFNEAYMDAYGMAISKSRTEHPGANYPVGYLPMAMGRQIMAGGDQTAVRAYAAIMIAEHKVISIFSVLLIESRHVLINVDLSPEGGDVYLYDCAVNFYKYDIMKSYNKFFKPFRCHNKHTWKTKFFDAASPCRSVTDASQSSPFVCAAMDIIAHQTNIEHFKRKLTNSMMPKVRTLICAFLQGLLYP